MTPIMPLLIAACGGYETKEDELHVNHNIKMSRSDRIRIDQLLSQVWKKYFIEPSQSLAVKIFQFSDARSVGIQPVGIDGRILTQEEEFLWLAVLEVLVLDTNAPKAEKDRLVEIRKKIVDGPQITLADALFFSELIKKYASYLTGPLSIAASHVMHEVSVAQEKNLPVTIHSISPREVQDGLSNRKGSEDFLAFVATLGIESDFFAKLNGHVIDWVLAENPNTSPTVIVYLDEHTDISESEGMVLDWYQWQDYHPLYLDEGAALGETINSYGSVIDDAALEKIEARKKQIESEVEKNQLSTLLTPDGKLQYPRGWPPELREQYEYVNAVLQLHKLQEHCQGKNDIPVRQADVLQMTSAYTILWEAEKNFSKQVAFTQTHTRNTSHCLFQGQFVMHGYEDKAVLEAHHVYTTLQAPLRADNLEYAGLLVLRSQIAIDNTLKVMRERRTKLAILKIGSTHYASLRASAHNANFIFVRAERRS